MYTFDGSLVDTSGFGHDCSAYGSFSYAEDRFGNAASALSLSGAQDCGSIGGSNCAGLDCGSTLNDAIAGYSEFSICAWAYVESFNDGAIFQAGTAADCEIFSVRTQSSGGWKLQGWGGCDVSLASYGTSTGVWQHHCAVYDGSTLTNYIDASAVASNSLTFSIATGEQFYIGFYSAEDGNGFNGRIDDVGSSPAFCFVHHYYHHYHHYPPLQSPPPTPATRSSPTPPSRSAAASAAAAAAAAAAATGSAASVTASASASASASAA